MNLSSSQFSSGCESGWTSYLDQSSHSKNECYSFGGNVDEEYAQTGARVDHDEEEDLSMVSDASSGPRHCGEDEDCFDENGCFCSPPSASELARKNKKKHKIKQHGVALHLQGKSTFKKHFDFFKSSLAEKPASGKRD
ncbi:hypothetical protein Pint_08632 [Pistacia integerrima]|uniref:Uncharacterized protein n=1 Tax=Pistacia integerrima TaxID=434235 RepID=A0ACC0XUF4_9ROSI|nr:hypothetical protein Pint_08632 [Pistacia integerrima]